MVAPIRKVGRDDMMTMTTASGMMHGIVLLASGKPPLDEATIAEHVRAGRIREAVEFSGLPSMYDFFKDPPPTAEQVRRYLAECCRRWLAMLEEKPNG